MANILFLAHRLPYPPNKGDKVRSYNLIKHISKEHRVFVGTFIDDPTDSAHVVALRNMCAELEVVELNPRFARIRALNGLLADEPLSIRYYRDHALQNWVNATCRSKKIDLAIVFCSAMAQYIEQQNRLPLIVDFVDVDSEKWQQYSPNHRWPMSWLYQREGEKLLAYERQLAKQADRSFFVSEAEATLFKSKAPECCIRVGVISNGVDTEYFSPDPERLSPFVADEIPIVFTGTMDYWPNTDAANWFALEVLPVLLSRDSKITFYIVGRNPTPEILALAGDKVKVTGTVADIRPYLQYAALVVAPLRIARGFQNKILEAMAMARPVIATAECAKAIDAESGTELITATTVTDFVSAIESQLSDLESSTTMGRMARNRAIASYNWETHMAKIDPYLTKKLTGEPQ